MKDMVIGVVQRVTVAQPHGERRDSLAQDWAPFLAALGFRWLPLPNAPGLAVGYAESFGVNGLLLTGGDGVGDCPERDETERRLLARAEREGWPAVGVCRGFQALWLYLGGALKEADVARHVRRRHDITFADGTRREVNSFHRFTPDDSGRAPLEPLARCEADGGLEAALGGRFLGLMWHPERETPPQEADLRLLREHYLGF